MLYEDPTKDISSDERFHVELHFSPGVNCCVQKELPPGPGFRPHSRSKGSNSFAELDVEPSTPPPPLVCSIKCSKDSFVNAFERSGNDVVFEESTENMELDLDFDTKTSTSAVSEPIEIKVTNSTEDDGKVTLPLLLFTFSKDFKTIFSPSLVPNRNRTPIKAEGPLLVTVDLVAWNERIRYDDGPWTMSPKTTAV